MPEKRQRNKRRPDKRQFNNFQCSCAEEICYASSKNCRIKHENKVDLLEGLVGTLIVLPIMKLLNGYQTKNTNTDF